MPNDNYDVDGFSVIILFIGLFCGVALGIVLVAVSKMLAGM